MATVEGFIYALSDPESPSVPRYIGRTKQSPRQRMCEHLAWSFKFPSHPLSKWLQSFISRGVLPHVMVYEIAPLSTLKIREEHWIRTFRLTGSLLNINNGDGPGPNWRISELNRQKTIERNKKGWTPQQRIKLVAALSRPWSKERKEQWRNRPRFAAWLSNIQEANKTRPWSNDPEKTKAKWAAHESIIALKLTFQACNERRKKPVVCVETGQQFGSMAEAVKRLGCSYNGFKEAMRRGWKCRGVHWVFDHQSKEQSLCPPQ